ncbi:beta-1,3-galactosyltransferase 4-like, partial [Empidonax traillii]|uniref:beta-1,3-galactosyltransferase 4-like n=1 Tax=Empidonax traillii TaxID=164674 RepID=UPI000FFD487E
FLLVLVPSAPSHLPRRLAVRDTWGRPPPTTTPSSPPVTRTLFVLGVPPTPNSQRELLREWRLHGDLLQGDFGDSYSNLTLKTLLLLRWALTCCGGAPFVLKADDDTFVNPPAIATYLLSPSTPRRLYLGRVHWRVAPDRDPRSRHHVPARLYRDSAFPPYCSGTAYVLSRQAAAAVLAAAPRVPLVGPEDVWVGLCARRAGVAPRHSARFGGSARVPPERCCLGEVMFSAHRLRPHELRGLWGGPGGACGVVQRLLGVLRCRGLALWEWLWGG